MAFDHNRLRLENKLLEKQIFAFDKFTLQNLANKSRGVNQPFIHFVHHI